MKKGINKIEEIIKEIMLRPELLNFPIRKIQLNLKTEINPSLGLVHKATKIYLHRLNAKAKIEHPEIKRGQPIENIVQYRVEQDAIKAEQDSQRLTKISAENQEIAKKNEQQSEQFIEQKFKILNEKIEQQSDIITQLVSKIDLLTKKIVERDVEQNNEKLNAQNEQAICNVEQPLQSEQLQANSELNKVEQKLNTVEKPVKKRTSKEFIAPTFEDVLIYAKEKDQSPDFAKKFYEYYAAGDWHDKNGKKVQRWKQTFISWINNSPVQSRNNAQTLIGFDQTSPYVKKLDNNNRLTVVPPNSDNPEFYWPDRSKEKAEAERLKAETQPQTENQ